MKRKEIPIFWRTVIAMLVMVLISLVFNKLVFSDEIDSQIAKSEQLLIEAEKATDSMESWSYVGAASAGYLRAIALMMKEERDFNKRYIIEYKEPK